MQDIERLAVMAMIGSIRAQLDGLETLIAGGARLAQPQQHRTVRTPEPTIGSTYATPDEEARVEQMLKDQREASIRSMAAEGAKVGQQLWQEAAAESQQ